MLLERLGVDDGNHFLCERRNSGQKSVECYMHECIKDLDTRAALSPASSFAQWPLMALQRKILFFLMLSYGSFGARVYIVMIRCCSIEFPPVQSVTNDFSPLIIVLNN